MPITYGEEIAVLTGIVAVDDAEALLEWLQSGVPRRVDLSGCVHMHAANLQVLMACGPTVCDWPADGGFACFLQDALGAAASAQRSD